MFRNSGWEEGEEAPDILQEGELCIDFIDRDIGIITYRPTFTGSGIAYLGFTPRSYYDEESACRQRTRAARQLR